jgi:hypothetical protein
MTPHRRGTSAVASPSEQRRALDRVVQPDQLTARDRLAAILVLVFGQQLEDVVRLRVDDVTSTDETVTISLGSIQIALPPPLDEPYVSSSPTPAKVRQPHTQPLLGSSAAAPPASTSAQAT